MIKTSLRQKIYLHFFVFMGINAVVWFLMYYNYNTMDNKLRLIETKNELFNIILEARRYEKNFFLRHDPKDLKQAVSFAENALVMQKKIVADFQGYIQNSQALDERISEIQSYLDNLSALVGVYDQLGAGKETIAETTHIEQYKNDIATLGRRITLETERIENEEKARLYKLLNQSKKYFVISLLALLLLSIITAFFLAFNVNRPLKIIGHGIRYILNGDYSKIPHINTGDEFESLAHSLNNMIDELNRRNEQLFQAEKMSSLGTLTSGVAHELNNPLNNISTSVQIVLEELDQPDIEIMKDLLSDAEKQVDRARDIVKALLEFSRQSDFLIKRHSFKKLVENTLMLIKGDIPSNIDLDIQMGDDVYGYFDFSRMQQVLLNLIINSTHAMVAGGRLSIEGYEEEGSGMFVFKVSDTGIGIPAENLNRIFDPFFTTKEVGKGSGLGLSIIHGIVEKHKGRIEVDSRLNAGTAFTIFLPLQPEV
ncbi:MAG: HAMP domain-containing protein [Desulfobacteraceae bacterium]|nr:MAG: HAMP domain-containing protein [Desulfobacteraceae bacterium]